MPAIFQLRIAKKINQAPSVRVIVICSDHRLLWRDSYKGVDRALTPDESILHKIIIIRNLYGLWNLICRGKSAKPSLKVFAFKFCNLFELLTDALTGRLKMSLEEEKVQRTNNLIKTLRGIRTIYWRKTIVGSVAGSSILYTRSSDTKNLHQPMRL